MPVTWDDEKPSTGKIKWDDKDSTFAKMSVSDKAKAHLADKGSETRFQQAQADAQGDINSHLQTAATAAAMAPFVLLAPVTGGASVPVGLALTGAAGVAGGLTEIGVKKLGGSTDLPKDKAAFLATLGGDAAFAMAGEGALRGVAAIGKGLMPGLLAKVASKSEYGMRAVQSVMADVRQRLYPLVSHLEADTTTVLADLYHDVGSIPRLKGNVGKSVGAMSERAAKIIGDIEADLRTVPTGVALKQPVDALIRMKGSLGQTAGMEWEEAVPFRKAAEKLDGIIKSSLKGIPEAQALYKQSNTLMRAVNDNLLGSSVAARVVREVFTPRNLLTGGGAYYGYRRGGLEGAAVGAAAGAAVNSEIPKLAAFLLQRAVAEPVARAGVFKAIEAAGRGAKEQAKALMKSALSQVGGKAITEQHLESLPQQ